MRLSPAVTALAAGLVGAIIAVGVMLWEPWNSGDSDPLLTGGEAAANMRLAGGSSPMLLYRATLRTSMHGLVTGLLSAGSGRSESSQKDSL